MKKLISIITIVLLSVGVSVYSQSTADTTALIKEFNKVMAFTSQSSLYYSSYTKMEASPVIDPKDTISMTGEFYKHNTDIYSNSGEDELYVEDSLMIEINHSRKTIWLRKVDIATKKNLDASPQAGKKMLDMLKNNYTISKTKMSEHIYRLDFAERKQPYSNTATTTLISLEYSDKTFLPNRVMITVTLKQPLDEEMLEALNDEGIDASKLTEEIDGIKYLSRKQVMNIAYTTINNNVEMISKKPSYKSSVDFDPVANAYVGKGIYRDYEVTKMF